MHRIRSLILTLCLLLAALMPARQASAADVYFTRHFAETQHNLFLPFLYVWDSWGSLPVFGYPKSEAFMEHNADLGKFFMTQYLERNRLEHHPENEWPYRVLLGRLGDEILRRQGRDWQTFPKASPSAPHYFQETGHAIADVFWGYWSSHGLDFGDAGVSFREALALWGLPLSEPTMETNSSGDTVLTQWFERARFEYHPNNPDQYKVLLGLLGNELVAVRLHEPDFQPKGALDIPHAAGRRAALADAEFRNRPIPYRDDIQSIADQAAEEWHQAFDTGGDQNAVFARLNQNLASRPPFAQVIYASKGMWLTSQCRRIDARDPVQAPYGSSWSETMSAITYGVTSIKSSPCGPAVSFIIIGTW